MRELTIQDQVANRAYALTDKDSEVVLALINRLLDLYNDYEEPLTAEDIAALDEAFEHRDDPNYWTSAEDLYKELEGLQ